MDRSCSRRLLAYVLRTSDSMPGAYMTMGGRQRFHAVSAGSVSTAFRNISMGSCGCMSRDALPAAGNWTRALVRTYQRAGQAAVLSIPRITASGQKPGRANVASPRTNGTRRTTHGSANRLACLRGASSADLNTPRGGPESDRMQVAVASRRSSPTRSRIPICRAYALISRAVVRSAIADAATRAAGASAARVAGRWRAWRAACAGRTPCRRL